MVGTPREGAGRAERARRPTAGPCFMFADAESANLFFHLWVTLREGAGRAERTR